jgi:hypothetical protein
MALALFSRSALCAIAIAGIALLPACSSAMHSPPAEEIKVGFDPQFARPAGATRTNLVSAEVGGTIADVRDEAGINQFAFATDGTFSASFQGKVFSTGKWWIAVNQLCVNGGVYKNDCVEIYGPDGGFRHATTVHVPDFPGHGLYKWYPVAIRPAAPE